MVYLKEKAKKLSAINYQKRIIVFNSTSFKQLYNFETSKGCSLFFDYNVGNFQQVLRHGKNPPKLQNYLFAYETEIENKTRDEIKQVLENKLNKRILSRMQKVYCYNTINNKLFTIHVQYHL